MIIVECPHCGLQIEIKKLACKIFRHGVFKSNGKQISPHAPKKFCDKIFNQNKIYGCGKPFTVIQDTSGIWIGSACDYI